MVVNKHLYICKITYDIMRLWVWIHIPPSTFQIADPVSKHHQSIQSPYFLLQSLVAEDGPDHS